MKRHGWGSIAAGALAVAAMGIACDRDAEQPEESAKPGQVEEQEPGFQPSPSPPAATRDPRGGEKATMRQFAAGCPAAAGDVEVAVKDTEGGVALTFTAAEGDVDELRSRVRHMAQRYEMRPHRRHMTWRHMEGQRGMGPDQRGMGMDPMPAVEANVEEIDAGARLTMKPTSASQLGHLRQHARMQQQHMQSGMCWTWGQEGPGQIPPP